MAYQILKNFLTNRARKDDLYVPAMIFFLIRNEGIGKSEEIAKLIYIFEHKYTIQEYKLIVEKLSSKILEDYHLIEENSDQYKLLTWPLNKREIDDISKRCFKISNGFFKNIKEDIASLEV